MSTTNQPCSSSANLRIYCDTPDINTIGCNEIKHITEGTEGKIIGIVTGKKGDTKFFSL